MNVMKCECNLPSKDHKEFECQNMAHTRYDRTMKDGRVIRLFLCSQCVMSNKDKIADPIPEFADEEKTDVESRS